MWSKFLPPVHMTPSLPRPTIFLSWICSVCHSEIWVTRILDNSLFVEGSFKSLCSPRHSMWMPSGFFAYRQGERRGSWYMNHSHTPIGSAHLIGFVLKNVSSNQILRLAHQTNVHPVVMVHPERTRKYFSSFRVNFRTTSSIIVKASPLSNLVRRPSFSWTKNTHRFRHISSVANASRPGAWHCNPSRNFNAKGSIRNTRNTRPTDFPEGGGAEYRGPCFHHGALMVCFLFFRFGHFVMISMVAGPGPGPWGLRF